MDGYKDHYLMLLLIVVAINQPSKLAAKPTGSLRNIQTHVFCWGLNDKDQLGGPKGSKVKVPVLNNTLSALKCTQIAGGSKSLFCGRLRHPRYSESNRLQSGL